MTFEHKLYVLTDIEALHRKRNVPARQRETAIVRHNLRQGDFAKLHFNLPNGGEAMWVRCIEARQDYYVGRLDNQPVDEDAQIEAGDVIYFEPRHIREIMKGGQ
jgi:hypothetical protein